MLERDWFGFRGVRRNAKRWHGFKEPSGKSLCGRVSFGPVRKLHPDAECCARCAAVWGKRYPKRVVHLSESEQARADRVRDQLNRALFG